MANLDLTTGQRFAFPRPDNWVQATAEAGDARTQYARGNIVRYEGIDYMYVSMTPGFQGTPDSAGNATWLRLTPSEDTNGAFLVSSEDRLIQPGQSIYYDLDPSVQGTQFEVFTRISTPITISSSTGNLPTPNAHDGWTHLTDEGNSASIAGRVITIDGTNITVPPEDATADQTDAEIIAAVNRDITDLSNTIARTADVPDIVVAENDGLIRTVRTNGDIELSVNHEVVSTRWNRFRDYGTIDTVFIDVGHSAARTRTLWTAAGSPTGSFPAGLVTRVPNSGQFDMGEFGRNGSNIFLRTGGTIANVQEDSIVASSSWLAITTSNLWTETGVASVDLTSDETIAIINGAGTTTIDASKVNIAASGTANDSTITYRINGTDVGTTTTNQAADSTVDFGTITGGGVVAPTYFNLLEQTNGTTIIVPTGARTFTAGDRIHITASTDPNRVNTSTIDKLYIVTAPQGLAITTAGMVTTTASVASTPFDSSTAANAATLWSEVLDEVGEEVGREGLLIENTEPFTVAFTNDDTPHVATDGNFLSSGVEIADNFPNDAPATPALPTGFSDSWRFEGIGNPAFNEFGFVESTNTLRVGDFAEGVTNIAPQVRAALAQPNAIVAVTEIGSTTILTQGTFVSISDSGTSELVILMSGFDVSGLTNQTSYTLHFGTPGQGTVDDQTNILDWTHPDFTVTGGTALTQVRATISNASPIPVARIYIAANLDNLNTDAVASPQERSDILDVIRDGRELIVNTLIGTVSNDSPVMAFIRTSEAADGISRTLQFTSGPTSTGEDTSETDYIAAWFEIPVARVYGGARNKLLVPGTEAELNAATTGQAMNIFDGNTANITTLTFRRNTAAVSTASLQNMSATPEKIAYGAGLSESGDHLIADIDTSTMEFNGGGIGVKEDGINTPQLADGSVEHSKIGDAAIYNRNFGQRVVQTGNIDYHAVGRSELSFDVQARLDARSDITLTDSTAEVETGIVIRPTNLTTASDWEMHVRPDDSRYISFTEVDAPNLAIGDRFALTVTDTAGLTAAPTGDVNSNAVLRRVPITVPEVRTLTGNLAQSSSSIILSGIQIDGLAPNADNTFTIPAGTVFQVGRHISIINIDTTITTASITFTATQHTDNAVTLVPGPITPIQEEHEVTRVELDLVAGSTVGTVDLFTYLDALTPASTSGGDGIFTFLANSSVYQRRTIVHTAHGERVGNVAGMNENDFVSNQAEFDVTEIRIGSGNSRNTAGTFAPLTGVDYTDVAVSWSSVAANGEIWLVWRGNQENIEGIINAMATIMNVSSNTDTGIYFNGNPAGIIIPSASDIPYIRVIRNPTAYHANTANAISRALRISLHENGQRIANGLVTGGAGVVNETLPPTRVSAIFSNMTALQNHTAEVPALVRFQGVDASGIAVGSLPVTRFGTQIQQDDDAIAVQTLYYSHNTNGRFPDPMVPDPGSRIRINETPYSAGTTMSFAPDTLNAQNLIATIRGPSAQRVANDLNRTFTSAFTSRIGALWFADSGDAFSEVNTRVGIDFTDVQSGHFLEAGTVRNWVAPRLIPGATVDRLSHVTLSDNTTIGWTRDGDNFIVTVSGDDREHVGFALRNFLEGRAARRSTLYFRSDGSTGSPGTDAAAAALPYLALNLPPIPGYSGGEGRMTAIENQRAVSPYPDSQFDQAGSTQLSLYSLRNQETEIARLLNGNTLTIPYPDGATNVTVNGGETIVSSGTDWGTADATMTARGSAIRVVNMVDAGAFVPLSYISTPTAPQTDPTFNTVAESPNPTVSGQIPGAFNSSVIATPVTGSTDTVTWGGDLLPTVPAAVGTGDFFTCLVFTGSGPGGRMQTPEAGAIFDVDIPANDWDAANGAYNPRGMVNSAGRTVAVRFNTTDTQGWVLLGLNRRASGAGHTIAIFGALGTVGTDSTVPGGGSGVADVPVYYDTTFVPATDNRISTIEINSGVNREGTAGPVAATDIAITAANPSRKFVRLTTGGEWIPTTDIT